MKVLILHASAGAGHTRAAEALAGVFEQTLPKSDVVVTDILDYAPAVFRETYAKGYLRIVRRAPELWGYMYSRSDTKARVPWRSRVRSTFNKINTTTFFEFYKAFDPDIAVCTHFLPLELLSTRKRRKKHQVSLYCCVTDFAVHSLWIVERVNCYYVSTEEAKRQLLRRGQPDTDAMVSGIPIDPIFSEHIDRAQARSRLGLDPGLPTIMILSGGFGVGPTVELISSFKGHEIAAQIVAVAGSNETLREQTEQAAREVDMPIQVLGRVNNIHEIMDASDLLISKSGGLTSSEALAKGLPMLIIDPIPGQEQRNCEHLLETGAAMRLYETEDAPYKIKALLDDPEHLSRMREDARSAGRPHAAQTIVDDILSREESA